MVVVRVAVGDVFVGGWMVNGCVKCLSVGCYVGMYVLRNVFRFFIKKNARKSCVFCVIYRHFLVCFLVEKLNVLRFLSNVIVDVFCNIESWERGILLTPEFIM